MYKKQYIFVALIFKKMKLPSIQDVITTALVALVVMFLVSKLDNARKNKGKKPLIFN